MKQTTQRNRRRRVVSLFGKSLFLKREIVVAGAVTGAVILLRAVGLFQAWEWAAFDQYMRLRPAEGPDARVVIVGLDEQDIREIGQAIVPDEVYAKAIEKLKSQSPRAIGLDVYRDLPVEPGYSELVETFKTTPNLVGIRKVVGEAGREQVAPPPALAELGQVGANDIITDADNTVRRALLSVQAADGETVYSLGLYLALLYLDAEGIGPEMVGEDTWWLGCEWFEPFESNDGGYVKADAQGFQRIINYRGGARTYEQVSLLDVIEDRIPANWATDRVVLIGAVGDSFQDDVYTPYSSSLLSLPEPMPGVEVHASLTSQILSGALDGRVSFQSWPEVAEWLWVLSWGCVGSLLAASMILKRSHKIALGSVAAMLLGGSTYGLFLLGWWVPAVPALLSSAASATVMIAYLASRAGYIRRTFGRYLSDEIVSTLLENPEGQKLGGERRRITILTSDLRGFTSLSERLQPERVIEILNFYLGQMAEVIARHQGTIDEFMGDGILVLFGAPILRENDAQRAIACAIEMQLAMEKVNETIAAWGLPDLEMGIGIHTGEVVVGNIGSEKRTKYGVVGSPVNLTYRIEACTIGGQVLISQETLDTAGLIVKIVAQQKVSLKGIAEPITIYEVGGIGGPYDLQMARSQEVFSPLSVPSLIRFKLVKEKQMSGGSFMGEVVALSVKGALIETEAPVVASTELLSNLKINFLSLDSSLTNQDVYAKAVEKVVEKNQIQIHFTAVPPVIGDRLGELGKEARKVQTESMGFRTSAPLSQWE